MKLLIFTLILCSVVGIKNGFTQVPTQEQCQQADAQLNQVYQQLRGTLNDAQKQQLKQAQRDWIKKRDAFVSANPANPQGALYQATMQRVIQLRGIIGQATQPLPQQQLSQNVPVKFVALTPMNQQNREKQEMQQKTEVNMKAKVFELRDTLNNLYSKYITELKEDEKGKFIADQQNWEKNVISDKYGGLYFADFEKFKINVTNLESIINKRIEEINEKKTEKNITANRLYENKKAVNSDVSVCVQSYHDLYQNGYTNTINGLYFSKNNKIVTCVGSELKVWDKKTGICVRSISLADMRPGKIFISENKDNIIAIEVEKRVKGPKWKEISILNGSLIQEAEAGPRRQHWPAIKEGMTRNNLWGVSIDGDNLSKIKPDMDLSNYTLTIMICYPKGKNGEEIDIHYNINSFKEIIGCSTLSLNDIDGSCRFDDNNIIVFFNKFQNALLLGYSKSDNKYCNIQKVSNDDLSLYLKRHEIIRKSCSTYKSIDYNPDSIGDFFSDDPTQQLKANTDNGEVNLSLTSDPLKYIHVVSKDNPIENLYKASFCYAAKKILVSTKNGHLYGIDLNNIGQRFFLAQDQTLNNPLILDKGRSFSYTMDSSISYLFFSKWATPQKIESFYKNSDVQDYNDTQNRLLIVSSNSVSKFDTRNLSIEKTISVPSVNVAGVFSCSEKKYASVFAQFYGGLYCLQPHSNNITISSISNTEYDSNTKHVNLIYNVFEDSNIGTSYGSINNFQINEKGSSLFTFTTKGASSLLILDNNQTINIPSSDSVGGPWSGAAWINNDSLYLSSDYGISILNSKGDFQFSWLFDGCAINDSLSLLPGSCKFEYDKNSDIFSYVAPDSSIRILKYENGNSLKELLKLYISNKGIPIFISPEGFYATFAPSQAPIAFSKNSEAFPLEQFDLRLNRPDIILNKLGFSSDIVSYAKIIVDKRLSRLGLSEEKLADDYHVPEVSIIEHPPKISILDSLSFKIKASDDKYPLDRLRVYVNNVPVNGRDGELLRDQKTQSLEKTIPIKLAAGRNKIQVSVLNNAGAESLYANAEVNCTADRPKPKLYAVALGVSQYDRPEWCLKYAAKDASDLIGKLKAKAGSSYSEVKPLLLTDKEVTKESVAKIKEFLAGATIDDTVLIFMAGHGLLDDKYDYYFGTTDIDPAKPSERGMPYEAIDNIFAEVPSLKKALLMDTCHAGELDDDEKKDLAASDGSATPAGIPAATDNSSPMAGKVAMRSIGTRGMQVKAVEGAKGKSDWYEKLQDMFVDLRRGSGATVISSSQGAEYAFESSEQSNGLFTYALMEALDGKATPNKEGQITISTVGDYVKKRVQDLTKGKQNPNLRGVNLEEDFALSSTK